MTWIAFVQMLRAAWSWLKTNLGWVCLMTVGAYTGARLLKRKDSQVESMKEALEVQKHQAAIEHLKGRREEVLKQEAVATAKDRELAQKAAVLELNITEQKRKIAQLHDKTLDVQAMTNSEVEEFFKNAGL